MTPHLRSPLSIDRIEAIVAVMAAMLTWFGFRYQLEYTAPWCGGPWSYCQQNYHPPYRIGDRRFNQFALPLAVIISLSAVSVSRAIRGGIQHFSRQGHFLAGLPLFTFPVIQLFYILLPWPPVLLLIMWLILSGFAGIYAVITRRDYGDLTVLPLNIGWLVFSFVYDCKWFAIYGD